MWLNESIRDKHHKEITRRPLMQKDMFPVSISFRKYLENYGREVKLPVLYSDLTNYSHANSLKDKKGKWTHWENAVYEPHQLKELKEGLVATYFLLKKQAKQTARQYDIESVDFCDYGNSVPFRIKIADRNNGRRDFFYIKKSDASRVYGLELEHLLTPNPINFLHYKDTLVEEHIEGIPGDVFLQQNPHLTAVEKAAVASAFVQFNERCFARLLGDMRSYNFVVNPFSTNSFIPAGEGKAHVSTLQYGIRAIDFDQQCYEGKKALYFPGYYKENTEYVDLVLQQLDPVQIEQKRQNEFDAMASRMITYRKQLIELINSILHDDISENYKIQNLRNELNAHFNTTRFISCKTMGAIVKQQLKQVLQKHVRKIRSRETAR